VIASRGAAKPDHVRPLADLIWALIRRLHLGARRAHNWTQLFHFCVIGGVGYVINLTVFALLVHTCGLHHIAAAVGAFCIAVINNFVWNRRWTFRHCAVDGRTSFQAARFFAVSLGSLCLNIAALELLVGEFEVPELSAQALAVAIAMPVNFTGNKLWTFG
jgi:putative flippase GtrA